MYIVICLKTKKIVGKYNNELKNKIKKVLVIVFCL